ncbi:MAG: HEPN domain-containing protein [Candidatus Lokiarchaeota archaeon]|nr:HEPN domain-containing protein [Candidatus Lokiarchaeota archaeon]
MSPRWVFNPKDFRRICDLLMNSHEDSNSECYFRTVMNRSYLMALQVTAAHILQKGAHLPSDHTYYGVVKEKMLVLGADPEMKDKLSDLQELRADADYCYCKHLGRNDAIEAISLARDIISHMDTLYPGAKL